VQARAVGRSLEIDRNDFGCRIVIEIIEHIALIDINSVSQRDRFGHIDATLKEKIQQDVAEHAALRDDGKRPGRQGFLKQLNGGEAVFRIDDADTIGADHPQAETRGQLPDFLLQNASFFACFGKSGTFYDYMSDAALGDLCERSGNGTGRYNDNGQINRSGYIRYFLISFHAADFTAGGVYQKSPVPPAVFL